MRVRLVCRGAIFALAFAWILPGIAIAQQVVGNVTELSGSVELQRGSSRQPATLGSAIDLHDQLTTGPNSSATVRLVDNSTIALSDSTSMTFDENVVSGATRQRTVLRLIVGAISSLVTPNAGGAFEVHTPNAVAAVRGTDFDTTYIEGSARPGFGGCQRYTDIKVREGVVDISNVANPGEAVEIDAGYETTVPCLLPPLSAGPLGIAGAVGPGAHGGGRTGSAGGASGGAAAAAVGFAAPPPGTGSAPAPAAVTRVVQ